MVLEATMICMDNSEWMRNGDFVPTRLEAQQDAVNLICGVKQQQNPENTVGVLTMAGRTDVLVTLTADIGKILSAIHNIPLGGNSDVVGAVQVAQLALKHRQNKNQQQRIVIFVGSPVETDKNNLVRLAKRLKKNNVAVDIINYGEIEQNTDKLEAFIHSVNNNGNSHIVTIPPGPHVLSDVLIASPIINDSNEAGTAGNVDGGPGIEFGVDPNIDPELAMALRLSMEEERARQEAEAKRKAEEESKNSAPNPTPSEPVNTTVDSEMSDDPELAAALALSVQESLASQVTATTAIAPLPNITAVEAKKDEDMPDVDSDLALALQLSMQQSANSSSKPAETEKEKENAKQKEKEKETDKLVVNQDLSSMMSNTDFVNTLLKDLPGVDPNDARIKSVLDSFKNPQKKDEEKEGEK